MVDENNPQDENGSFENYENNDFDNDGFDNGNFENNGNDHFMEEDDFLAADRGEPDDLDAPPPKPNLKEIWEQNPSVKIFAVVAVVAVLLISYLVFGASSSEDEENQNQSLVSQGSDVSQPPGTQQLPPAYEQAVREESEKRAQEAANNGGSAIPTPIARPSERIEAPVQTEATDPLSEWRAEAAQRRAEREQDVNPTATNVPLLPTNTANLPPENTSGSNMQAAQPQNPPLPTAPTPDQITTIAQQLQSQMQTIMETQIPKESVVVSMNIQPQYDAKKYFGDENANNTAQPSPPAGNSASSVLNPGQPPQKPIVSAGTIAYGQIITQASSDVPGPVLAEVASGPLMGGRAIGQFSATRRQLVMQFNRIIKDGVEYQVSAYAIDPATTLPAVVTDIDRHYFSRIVLPAASRFIQGYADAATQRDTSVVVTNGTVVTNSNNDLDTKQEVLEGVNEGAQQFTSVLDQDFGNRPVTIKVEAGTRIGILFLSSVYDPAAMAAQMQMQGQQPQNSYQNYINQGFNAYNAYNNYGNAGSGGYNGYNNYNNGYNTQQQYYPQQQYQQQQYIPTPNFRSLR